MTLRLPIAGRLAPLLSLLAPAVANAAAWGAIDPAPPFSKTVDLTWTDSELGRTYTVEQDACVPTSWQPFVGIVGPGLSASAAPADGCYRFRVIPAGGTDLTPSDPVTVTVDNVPPSVPAFAGTPPVNDAALSGTLVVTSGVVTDNSSGVLHVALEFSVHGANNFSAADTNPTAPYSLSVDTTLLTDGDRYDLRLTSVDNALNTASSAAVTNLVIDNLPPTGLAFGPAAPAPADLLRGTRVVNVTPVADAGSGVLRVELQATLNGGWAECWISEGALQAARAAVVSS